MSSGMKFEEYKKLDIVGKLTFWRDLPHGAMLSADWPNVNQWDDHIREVAGEALDEIRLLRSVAGIVSSGPTFGDYRKRSKTP